MSLDRVKLENRARGSVRLKVSNVIGYGNNEQGSPTLWGGEGIYISEHHRAFLGEVEGQKKHLCRKFPVIRVEPRGCEGS